MNDQIVKSLGLDILWCAEADCATDQLAGRTRFLDELWLPCPLASLTEEQICLINRYRESVIETERRYDFARRAREILSNVARELNGKMVVEVGCGKFPVEVYDNQYLGVDIDEEAVKFVRKLGKAACNPDHLLSFCKNKSDVVISAYAMHFSISDCFLERLALSTTSDAIFCFNIINDDANCLLSLLGRMATFWPLVQVVKTDSMSRREFYFIAGKYDGVARLAQASEIIRT